MRYPRLVLFSFSIPTISLVLTGCGGTVTMSSSTPASGTGPVPTVIAVGEQVNGVAPNRIQEVQFSEAMDASTVNAQSFQITDASGKAAAGMVSYDPDFNTASFMPNPALQTGTTYTATLSTAVASAGGMHLTSPYSYTFATRASTDTSPISINSVDPAANAPCVSAASAITITFDEAPDPSTVIPANFTVSGPNGAIAVKISMNVATTQVVLTPASPLPSGTITITVNNIADLAGVKMAASYTWAFSTACSGGGGTGGTSTQYMAPLIGGSGGGQVTVDTAGNFTVQLHGATANQSLMVQFCAAAFGSQTAPNCFSIGSVSTDSVGNANLTARFPKPGNWAGDFELNNGPTSQPGLGAAYTTNYGPGYISTLVAGQINTGVSGSANGTITYSSSPAPNGSFTFTVTGGQADMPYGAIERDLYVDSHSYSLQDSQGQGVFTSDNAGNVTFTLLPHVPGGDIFGVLRRSSVGEVQDYTGGFTVPQ